MGLWQCLCSILQLDPVQVDVVRETATVPLSLGGLGLRSAQRTRIPAFWASWADSLAMIRQRHPDVAVQLVHQLEGHPDTPCLQAAADATRSIHGVRGFVPPSWEALSHGVRPELLQPDEFEPGCQRGGWQHEAVSRVEVQFRDENLFNRLDNASKALVRSQGGVGAGLAFSTCPLCRVTRLEPHLFRVLLLRRLRLPFSLSGRSCRCGLPLDSSGHHRAACARAGILGRRGFALESVRICREAGGRVTTNVMVRDLDLAAPNMFDARRLEVVVDGLPLFGGVQLAVDTTMVSALHANGEARRGAARTDGVALAAARRRKERTYPKLTARGARARLVVLGVEVGGRWSTETRTFLSLLAHGRARSERPLMRKRVEQAWRLRWRELVGAERRARFVVLAGDVGGRFFDDSPFLKESCSSHRTRPEILQGRAHGGALLCFVSPGPGPYWRRWIHAYCARGDSAMSSWCGVVRRR